MKFDVEIAVVRTTYAYRTSSLRIEAESKESAKKEAETLMKAFDSDPSSIYEEELIDICDHDITDFSCIPEIEEIESKVCDIEDIKEVKDEEEYEREVEKEWSESLEEAENEEGEDTEEFESD
jgi:hypothetical protein